MNSVAQLKKLQQKKPEVDPSECKVILFGANIMQEARLRAKHFANLVVSFTKAKLNDMFKENSLGLPITDLGGVMNAAEDAEKVQSMFSSVEQSYMELWTAESKPHL